jgi:hypothetical protein
VSAADEFPIPPGDPAAVTAAGDALAKVSVGLGALGKRIRAEQSGMSAAWLGDAGEAAGTETTTLATITGHKATSVEDGAKAFGDYGAALTTAIGEVRTIRRQADQAEVDALNEANRTGHGLPPDDKRDLYTSLRTRALTPLRMHYRSVIETLDRAATSAAGRLTAAVPEYRSGMKPADLALAVRDAVALRLPSVLQLDGQTRARDLAAQLSPLLEHGKKIPDDLLAKLEADKDNPWFAKTLLETLGPQAPNWAMLVMEAQGFPKDYNQRVITDFGQLLALSTRQTGDARLSDSYVRDFLKPLDQHNGIGLQYAWHLGNLLHYGGTFGTGFLQQAGDKLYALDKEGADSQMYTMVGGYMNRPLTADWGMPDDTMEAYFTAVAKDADAARVFFQGHADRLTYYLADRRTDNYLGDDGEALGTALEAATSVHDDGFRGQGSAEVTSDLVTLLGSQKHDFLTGHDRSKVLPHAANILNGYKDDVFYSLSRTDYGGAASTAARLGQPELGTKNWGVEFSASDLTGTLAQIDHDSEAYKSVVKAQLSASEEFLRDKLAAARQDPGRRDELLQSYARGHGLVLKQLFDTHINTQVAMGKLKDLDKMHDLRVVDAVSGSLMSILPLYPPAAIPVAVLSMGKSATMPFLFEGAANNSQADANRLASTTRVNQWYSATLGTMVTNMQDGGGFAGTPAEAGTWQAQHGISGSSQFTDATGHVLDPARMTGGQKAAYQQWLADPENEAVRVEMVKIFTALDAAGGQQGG